MKQDLARIAITGPESSGKTTLAKSLADNHHVPWVPEFARTYLSIDSHYTHSHLTYFAEMQMLMEDIYLGIDVSWILCDTCLLDLKIWSEVKYGKVDPWIISALADRYSAFLLCKPDFAWQADPLRENEDNRDKLFGIFRSFLIRSELPFIELSGAHKQRVDRATTFLTAQKIRK